MKRLALLVYGAVTIFAAVEFAAAQASQGSFAYTANFGSNSVSGYAIDPTTGTLAPVPGSPFPAEARPLSLTVDPTGRFAYVLNAGLPPFLSASISAFAIDAATGSLRSISGSPFSLLEGAFGTSATIDPSGKFLYVTVSAPSVNFGAIAAFAIDPISGVLIPVNGSPFAVGSLVGPLTFDPSGNFAYLQRFTLTNSGPKAVLGFAIDPSTGALIPVPNSPVSADSSNGLFQVTVDPTGRFAFVPNAQSVSSFVIDPATGSLSPVSESPFGAAVAIQVAVDPTGRFAYVVDNSCGTPPDGFVTAFTIDSLSGTLQNPVTAPAGSCPQSMLIDPTGSFAYVAGSGTITGYTIDATAGILTPIPNSPFPAGSEVESLTIDQSGRFIYAADRGGNDVLAYAIDATTGALTPVPGSPFAAGSNPQAVTITPVPAPLPSTGYSFATLDFPGAEITTPTSINDAGLIAGSYLDQGGFSHGFIYFKGSFTSIDYPGALNTIANGINDNGQIAGYFEDSAGNFHGFIDDQNTFKSLEFPGATQTLAYRINNDGQVAGYYQTDLPGAHGFLASNGNFVSIDFPNQVNTLVFGLNNRGQIVGENDDLNFVPHGFFDNNGGFTRIDFPGATSTFSWAVNDDQLIAGQYFSGVPVLVAPLIGDLTTPGPHGFALRNGIFDTIDYPGSIATSLFGVNNGAQLVGTFFNGTANHGFLATPKVPVIRPAPQITGLFPASIVQGQGNVDLTITGFDFQSASAVSITNPGITILSQHQSTATQIVASLSVATDAQLGPTDVTVTNPDGRQTTVSGALTVLSAAPTPSPAPSLTSIFPSSAVQGQILTKFTVNGSNFQVGASLSFSGDSGIIVDSSTITATQITANVRIAIIAATGPRDVTVTNPDSQNATLTGAFAVTPVPPLSAPTISLTPTLIDFGTVHPGGQPTVQTLTITNSGSARLLITGVTHSDPQFNVGPPTVSEIAPQSSTTLTISVSPAPGTIGPMKDVLTVAGNAPQASVLLAATSATDPPQSPLVIDLPISGPAVDIQPVNTRRDGNKMVTDFILRNLTGTWYEVTLDTSSPPPTAPMLVAFTPQQIPEPSGFFIAPYEQLPLFPRDGTHLTFSPGQYLKFKVTHRSLRVAGPFILDMFARGVFGVELHSSDLSTNVLQELETLLDTKTCLPNATAMIDDLAANKPNDAALEVLDTLQCVVAQDPHLQAEIANILNAKIGPEAATLWTEKIAPALGPAAIIFFDAKNFLTELVPLAIAELFAPSPASVLLELPRPGIQK